MFEIVGDQSTEELSDAGIVERPPHMVTRHSPAEALACLPNFRQIKMDQCVRIVAPLMVAVEERK
jgi:hypothetical protein